MEEYERQIATAGGWLKEFRTSPGCLIWLFVLLVFAGVITFLTFQATNSDDGSPQAGASPSASTSAPASPSAPGCEDETERFRTFALSHDGSGRDLVLDRISRVCWEATGQLRADADISADVEARSAPMMWLCGALSEFTVASGRTWHGFTVYSTRAPFVGSAFLTGREPGAACFHPARTPSTSP